MTQVLAPTVPTDLIGTWNIDPMHTDISFTVRHLMTKVRGHFPEFGGAITVAENLDDSASRVEVQMASIDTRNEMRDGHVRSSEVLDVENHPTMTFVSTGIEPRSDSEFALNGQLTIRGVTLPVTLNAEFLGSDADQFGNKRIGFSASTRISRKAFGLEFNIPLQGEKLLLSDEVSIDLDVQAIKA